MEKNLNSDEVNPLRDSYNDYGKRKYIILIIVGITFGFGVSQIYKFKFNYLESDYINLYNTVNQLNNQKNNKLDNFNFGVDIHETDDMTIANKLKTEVKVLCWIMTEPNNHQTRAQYISKTWGTRCNKLLIISSSEEKKFEIIGVPVTEGTVNLWNKTQEAFKYIHKHYIKEFDWFLRADDDTYVIVENLRFLLYGYDPNTPIYFGHKYEKQDYMVSGAGYVLSKEALKRFIEIGLTDPKKCSNTNLGIADVELGKCLYNVGVIAGNSNDSQNRSRFYGRRPEDLEPGKPDQNFGYWSRMYYETFTDKNCCSDHPISFHGIIGKQMYVLEYLIYHLRPYGMETTPEPLPDEITYIDN